MTHETRLQNIQRTISAVLGIEENLITEDSSADNLPGWDSVNHLNIIMALEEVCGTSFSPDDMMEMTSVSSILEKLAGNT
jgi:acyl carrier protein